MKLMYGVETSNYRFSNHHPHYKEKLGITESVYKLSLFWLPPQLLLPSISLSNYIVKVMKPLYIMPEASINCSVIYHSYYTEKVWMTKVNYDPCSDKLKTITSVY